MYSILFSTYMHAYIKGTKQICLGSRKEHIEGTLLVKINKDIYYKNTNHLSCE